MQNGAMELCMLLQDTHFLLKLVEFALTFIGFRYFFEGSKKNLLESMIINLAIPGGLITICILLFLYYKKEKSGSIEPILLTIYGLLNLLSGFIYLHECINANTCPLLWKIFQPSFIKTGTCLATGLTMLAESGTILYLPELQGKPSESAYSEGYDDTYVDPTPNTTLDLSSIKKLSEPYIEPTMNEPFIQRSSLARSNRSIVQSNREPSQTLSQVVL